MCVESFEGGPDAPLGHSNRRREGGQNRSLCVLCPMHIVEGGRKKILMTANLECTQLFFEEQELNGWRWTRWALESLKEEENGGSNDNFFRDHWLLQFLGNCVVVRA